MDGSVIFVHCLGRIDSESDEYDSELDDFIDDGDDNAPQDELSDVLRSVFGYDKSR